MKVAGFDRDDGNWPKCGKHGVSRDEVEMLFNVSPGNYADPDHSAQEQRSRAIGCLPSGRFVYVVFTLATIASATLIGPISARSMHRKEIEAYE